MDLPDILASERSTTPDPVTGRAVVRWTTGAWKDQHLYFTGPSVTADDRWLVLISERDGHPNLWAIDRVDGRLHRLTRNANGKRRSYCHGGGGERGFSKSAPCLDALRRRAYAIIDDRVQRIDLDDRQRHDLGALPEGWITSFTQVSPDGRWLCVPVANPEAFAGAAAVPDQATQMRAVWAQVVAGAVRSRLLLIDTTTGAQRTLAEVPFWITHVQFDPCGSGRILFNSECLWHEQDRIPRMWLAETDGRTHPLFAQPAGERIGHENWSADGRHVVYHGYASGDDFFGHTSGHFLARRSADGALVERIAIGDLGIHHATLMADGDYLVDTLDGRIGLVHPAGAETAIRTVCRSDTRNRADQDTHAHAIACPHGRSAVFSSDRAGGVDVYEISLSA